MSWSLRCERLLPLVMRFKIQDFLLRGPWVTFSKVEITSLFPPLPLLSPISVIDRRMASEFVTPLLSHIPKNEPSFRDRDLW